MACALASWLEIPRQCDYNCIMPPACKHRAGGRWQAYDKKTNQLLELLDAAVLRDARS